MRRLARLAAGLLAAGLLVALLIGGAALWGMREYEATGPLAAPRTIVIPKGVSTDGIGQQLVDAGIVRHRLLFLAAVRLTDHARPLKAGEYAIPAAASLAQVIELLREGKTVVHRLTVPEGLTVVQIFDLIRAEPALAGDLPAPPAEGSLLPETYNFSLNDARSDLVQRMKKAMDAALDEAWKLRAPDLPLTDKRQLLVLASVVEKETGLATERPRVASVFVNRLKRNMRLQSDPTVIYGITGGRTAFGRPLTRTDLDAETPYNSYARDGLPPGPICNPGKASLAGTAQPEPSNFLYFVADGSGGHAFAATLEQHNRNVAAWRKFQAEHPPQ